MTTNDQALPATTDERITELHDDAVNLRRAANRRDWLIAVLAVLVAGLIGVTTVLTFRLNDVHNVVNDLHTTAQGNHKLQQDIEANTQAIKDCTQPTGTCYKTSRAGTEALVNGAVTALASAVHIEACHLLDDLAAGGVLTPQAATAAKANERC